MTGASHAQILSLYRNIIRHARVFPSISRDRMVTEIRMQVIGSFNLTLICRVAHSMTVSTTPLVIQDSSAGIVRLDFHHTLQICLKRGLCALFALLNGLRVVHVELSFGLGRLQDCGYCTEHR